jgi:hypothetical protein
MRTITLSSKLFFILAFVFCAGCSGLPSVSLTPTDLPPCTRYGPARVDIIPLTSFVPAQDSGRNSTINVYVCLLDSFDSQVKAPAVFRFELFEHIQRSADPKGKRIVLWPDLDLTDPTLNNNHWQDFLRAYLFSLPLQKPLAGASILRVTCLCPSGKRLWADFLIKSTR